MPARGLMLNSSSVLWMVLSGSWWSLFARGEVPATTLSGASINCVGQKKPVLFHSPWSVRQPATGWRQPLSFQRLFLLILGEVFQTQPASFFSWILHHLTRLPLRHPSWHHTYRLLWNLRLSDVLNFNLWPSIICYFHLTKPIFLSSTHTYVACHLFYMFAYLFTQQIFIELLLCTRHRSRCWGYRRGQNKVPAFKELRV